MPEGACILVASAHLPSSRAREAGQRIVFAHLRLLAERHRVVLASFANAREREDVDPALASLCEEVLVLPLDDHHRLAGVVSRPFAPVFVGIRSSGRMRRAIADLIARHRPSTLWLEYAEMAQYGSAGGSIRRVITVVHDVVSQRLERSAERARGLRALAARMEARRAAAWERRTLARIGRCVVLSRKDAQLLAARGIAHPEVIYPSVEPPRGATARAALPTLLFFGAFNRRENVDAALWLITEVWPLIAERLPQSRLVIAGAAPTEAMHAAAKRDARVQVTGFVEDPAVVFGAAWTFVAPIRLGAGVKIKVLEALGAGLPVVATPAGAEGIDAATDDGLVIAPEDEVAVADACLRFLGDRSLAERTGNVAAQWFDERYRSTMVSAESLAALTGS